jgi:hypothetical protein
MKKSMDMRLKMKWERPFLIFLAILTIPLGCYRFNHPEKTQTQLFLDTFKAYQEFFTPTTKQETTHERI